MDCESFERIVLDRLFLELDDLSMGAAQRHVAHCSRCRGIEAGLKATREVCRLPVQAPPEEFVEGILSLERQLRAILPMRQRANRAISVLAGYAMRPQPTMAVLLLLMIGASLFLVRAHRPERDLVQVTERGVPEGEVDSAQVRSPPSPNANDTQGQLNAAAPQRANLTELPAASAPASSTRDFASVKAERDLSQVESELRTARQTRVTFGCARAIASFESIRLRQPNSDIGFAAAWEAAECCARLDRKEEARTLLNTLITSPQYSKRAEMLLRSLDAP